MESLLHILLSNALAATVLAVIATCVGRSCRRPALDAQSLAVGHDQVDHAALCADRDAWRLLRSAGSVCRELSRR